MIVIEHRICSSIQAAIVWNNPTFKWNQRCLPAIYPKQLNTCVAHDGRLLQGRMASSKVVLSIFHVVGSNQLSVEIWKRRHSFIYFDTHSYGYRTRPNFHFEETKMNRWAPSAFVLALSIWHAQRSPIRQVCVAYCWKWIIFKIPCKM